MDINTSPGPVGKVVAVPGLGDLIEKMKAVWAEHRPTAAWWQFWKGVNFVPAAQFLVRCLDDLVSYVAAHEIPGADKKATVLDALGTLYDWTVAAALPIWLRPFNGAIKNLVVNVAASAVIDWLAAKYKDGGWRPRAGVLNLWGVPGGHRPV